MNMQAYSDIIMHIQKLCRDIPAHSETCVTSASSEPWYIESYGIFGTLLYAELVYTEPWHIQNQSRIYSGIFRTLNIFTTQSHIWDLLLAFYKNNINSLFPLFSNAAKCDLRETSLNKVELEFNIQPYSGIIRHIQEFSRDI